MNGTHLTGLEGTNPLGFFAALGVQALFDYETEQPQLWWSDDVVPHAVVNDSFSVDRIVDQACNQAKKLLDSRALNPGLKSNDDVKFSPEELRKYLEQSQGEKPGNTLAAALVAEGSVVIKKENNVNKLVAKPTGFYFTAGRQLFLDLARKIVAGAEPDDYQEALLGPWTYSSDLKSFGWDVVDDRNYALVAFKPSKDTKKTNPGAEVLALFGLTRYPAYHKDRTITYGCGGSWEFGHFTWPLWGHPAGAGAVRALIAQTPTDEDHSLIRGWGVRRLLRSAIRRKDPGGLGTFSPPSLIWSASAP